MVSGAVAALVLLCAPSHGLRLAAYPARHACVGRRRPSITLCVPPAAAADGGGDDDDPPPPLRAVDLSKELAKYDSRGLRVRQSAPVRRSLATVADAVGEAGALARWFSSAATAVPVHQQMMVLCLVGFGAQSAAPRAAMVAGARVNAAILAGQWHRLVSPVFLHGGGMHLLSNLFSLWRVGPLVEAAFGPARTLLLYLLAGVGGNLAGLAWGSPKGMSIGASGAVFGLMGAVGGFVLRNRRALGSYGDLLLRNTAMTLALNLYVGTRRGSGIDNLAHVGGFLTGGLLAILLAPQSPRGRGRWDDEPRNGDGTLLPPWAVSALLAATVSVYALGLREAATIALKVTRVYGRR